MVKWFSCNIVLQQRFYFRSYAITSTKKQLLFDVSLILGSMSEIVGDKL